MCVYDHCPKCYCDPFLRTTNKWWVGSQSIIIKYHVSLFLFWVAVNYIMAIVEPVSLSTSRNRSSSSLECNFSSVKVVTSLMACNYYNMLGIWTKSNYFFREILEYDNNSNNNLWLDTSNIYFFQKKL